MKATINLPDALYREVKAKSAREGRSVREVTIALFQRWLAPSPGTSVPPVGWLDHRPPLRDRVDPGVTDHSLEAIRESIAEHWDEPR